MPGNMIIPLVSNKNSRPVLSAKQLVSASFVVAVAGESVADSAVG